MFQSHRIPVSKTCVEALNYKGRLLSILTTKISHKRRNSLVLNKFSKNNNVSVLKMQRIPNNFKKKPKKTHREDSVINFIRSFVFVFIGIYVGFRPQFFMISRLCADSPECCDFPQSLEQNLYDIQIRALESKKETIQTQINDFQKLFKTELQNISGILLEKSKYWQHFAWTDKLFSVGINQPKQTLNWKVTTSLESATNNMMNYLKNQNYSVEEKWSPLGYFRSGTKYAEEFILLHCRSHRKFYFKVRYSNLKIRESPYDPYKCEVVKSLEMQKRVKMEKNILKFFFSEVECKNEISIVVPFCCRQDNLRRYLQLLETARKGTDINFNLIIMSNEDDKIAESITRNSVTDFFFQNGTYPILLVLDPGPFQRGLACQSGASLVDLDGIIFYMDVDLDISADLLERIKFNTIKGKQIYYPIMYSQYEFHEDWTKRKIDSFKVNEYTGYWRIYSYGMLAIYKTDFDSMPGFNTDIEGWGLEDQYLIDMITEKNRFHIFRTADMGLMHIFHDKGCNRTELEDQFHSCMLVKLSHLAPVRTLSTYILNNSNIWDTEITF